MTAFTVYRVVTLNWVFQTNKQTAIDMKRNEVKQHIHQHKTVISM